MQEVAPRLKSQLARLKSDVREGLDRENSMFAKPEAKESTEELARDPQQLDYTIPYMLRSHIYTENKGIEITDDF